MRYAYTLLIALIVALSANAQTVESGYSTQVEVTAPGAGGASGQHNVYFDSTSGRLVTHKNGGSAIIVNYNITHATDCTGVTVVGTGVALVAGDRCHELDDDTNYVYDGAAWDLVGGGGTSSLAYSCVISSDSTTSSSTLAEMATPKTCTIPASTLSVGDFCLVEMQFAFTDDADTTGTWAAYPTLNGTATGDALIGLASETNAEVFRWAKASFSVDSTTVAEFNGRSASEDDGFGMNNQSYGTRDIDTSADIAVRFMGLVSDTGDTLTFKYGSVQCWTN